MGPGLQRRLLLLLLGPLLLLAALNTWFDYQLADSPAIQQDRQLLTLVPQLVDSIHAHGAWPPQKPGFQMAPEIAEFLALRPRRAAYAVLNSEGKVLLGEPWLGDYPPPTYEPEFSSQEYQGVVYRIVSQRVIGSPGELTVRLADGVRIGPHCVVRDAVIGQGTRVEAFSHIFQAEVGCDAHIGPFARLRPGAKLADRVHVGNFVEIKNTPMGEDSKANHLAYIGDADIGARVNIGAGTITCNYDGVNKFRTVIEDDAFIGSDTQLVAPVRVGRGATLGAGTTLSKDAPPDQLTISRVRQTTVQGWKRPVKKS